MNDFENYYEDEEELDLLKLVSTNANDANQYLIFEGTNNELYAKNVSKVDEIVIYKDIDIAFAHEKPFVIGTGDIRSKMITLVDFDAWIGNTPLDESDRELVIIAHYGGHIIGLVVHHVDNIITIESDQMSDNSNANPKSSFITKITLNRKERLCTIFDSDKLLIDIFDEIRSKSEQDREHLSINIHSKKLILAADDSKVIRSMMAQLLDKLQVNFEIFEDGALLIDALGKKNPEDVGLIITDIEMPIMSGREVISTLRLEEKYNNINIIVHTNMSNHIMEEELLHSGASQIIGKVNMLELGEAIAKNIR